jgi:hypothetical protein
LSVVDYHGFTTLTPTVRTTGKYLHELGIFPHPNVKGSDLDHGMQHILTRDERSAAYMADGYARASGQTAFVQVHSDAGTAYALGQIANAFRDRVPVVITAGGQSTTARGQNVFLEAPNLAQLPRDYTRWTWDVLNASTIPEVLRRAFLLGCQRGHGFNKFVAEREHRDSVLSKHCIHRFNGFFACQICFRVQI